MLGVYQEVCRTRRDRRRNLQERSLALLEPKVASILRDFDICLPIAGKVGLQDLFALKAHRIFDADKLKAIGNLAIVREMNQSFKNNAGDAFAKIDDRPSEPVPAAVRSETTFAFKVDVLRDALQIGQGYLLEIRKSSFLKLRPGKRLSHQNSEWR
jgi:hypothetical protein